VQGERLALLRPRHVDAPASSRPSTRRRCGSRGRTSTATRSCRRTSCRCSTPPAAEPAEQPDRLRSGQPGRADLDAKVDPDMKNDITDERSSASIAR
jgi:hypothetical protein